MNDDEFKYVEGEIRRETMAALAREGNATLSDAAIAHIANDAAGGATSDTDVLRPLVLERLEEKKHELFNKYGKTDEFVEKFTEYVQKSSYNEANDVLAKRAEEMIRKERFSGNKFVKVSLAGNRVRFQGVLDPAAVPWHQR